MNIFKIMNYYKIHPNKKPKRIPERIINPKKAHTNIIAVMGAVQIRTIQSQPFISINDKKINIAEAVLKTATAISNLWSPKQKYLDRINNTK